MRTSIKFVSAVAAIGLVAGAGLAAAPAQAKTTAVVKGSTGITVPMTLIQAAGAAGVTLAPLPPATASATADSVIVGFPVSAPKTDGVLPHRGGLGITSAATSLNLTWRTPWIEYATSGGTTGSISGVIGGIPADNMFAALNGKRSTLFDISNLTIKNTKGKVTKSGKVFKRVYTQTITGNVSVVNNPTVVDILNGLLGVPLFTAGMPFGTLNSSWTSTRTCTVKSECA